MGTIQCCKMMPDDNRTTQGHAAETRAGEASHGRKSYRSEKSGATTR